MTKKQQPMKDYLVTYFDENNEPVYEYVTDWYYSKSLAVVHTQKIFEEMREKHGKFIDHWEMTEFNGYEETEN